MPKECAVLIEPPGEEILAADVRSHQLVLPSSKDPAIPRHTTKTFGKWFTRGKEDTYGKWDTHAKRNTQEQWDTPYGKCDLDAKWNTHGKWDQGEPWDTHKTLDPTDFPKETCIQHTGSDSNPHFKLGQGRELMGDNKNQLAALSPMSDAIFGIPGTENKDVQDVVETTNKCQVAPLACKCFPFLLHHPCRHDAEHLCTLLEMTHCLHRHREEYDQCLAQMLRHGGKVLSKPTALAQLCNNCLLDIVQADHLQEAHEILVSNAIPAWTAPPCTLQDPSWGEGRSMAGELVHHGRDLTVPSFTLIHPPECPSSSSQLVESLPSSSSLESPSLPLLTKGEVEDLVHQEGPPFPAKREKKRWVIHGGETIKGDAFGKRTKQVLWVGLAIFILLFTFLLQYVLVRFLVGPLVHNVQETDMSSGRAVNQTRYS